MNARRHGIGTIVLLAVSVVLSACDLAEVDLADETDQFSASLTRTDAREGETPLDLKDVRVRDGASKLTITVTTHEDWSDVALGAGRSDLLVHINTTEDGEFNRYVHIVHDKVLYCDLHHWEGERLERQVASRRNDRSVTCVFDAASIPRPSERFRWSAATNYPGQYTSQREWDWAPDVGYFELD
ncbi:MAG: hypothetical protein GEU71_07390 [Actinobacteria bacterium]|nr:hypothetical protein [Actinomycetota bacterium]